MTVTNIGPQMSAHQSARRKSKWAKKIVCKLDTDELASDHYTDLVVSARNNLRVMSLGRSRPDDQSRPDADEVECVIRARSFLGAMGADAPLAVLTEVNEAIELLDGALDDWGIDPPDRSEVGSRPYSPN
jgi:hypothetical protein